MHVGLDTSRTTTRRGGYPFPIVQAVVDEMHGGRVTFLLIWSRLRDAARTRGVEPTCDACCLPRWTPRPPHCRAQPERRAEVPDSVRTQPLPSTP